jgi:transcriptional regulator with XRE-family HTH domain
MLILLHMRLTTTVEEVTIEAMTKTQWTRLRILREARGLSLREAAKLARIDAGQLSRLERGRGSLSIGAAVRLARVLGLPDVRKVMSPFVAQERDDDR